MAPLWLDLLLFVALLILFVVVLFFSRITQTHKVYLVFHFIIMLWPIGQFSLSMTTVPEYQLLFINLSLVSLGLLGPSWLFFVLFLTGKATLMKKSHLMLAVAPALVGIVISVWNPQQMFVRSIGGSYLEREYGQLFWVFLLVQVVYFVVALHMMFQTLRTVTSYNQRKQIGISLLGIFLLTGCGMLDVLINVLLAEFMPVVPGILALGILLSNICFVVAIRSYGMFDTLSMAQRDVFEFLPTGIIVIDENSIILKKNRTAANYVQTMIGEIFEIESILSSTRDKAENQDFIYRYVHLPYEWMQMEFAWKDKHISIQISPVWDDNHEVLIGRVITLHDVSELRKLVDEMNRKNEALHERNLELITIQEQLFHLNQKLEQMAITDGLTGCYNRRFMMQQLEHEVSLNQRYKIPFSIILFDVDYFKHINDHFGHLVGDEVLISTAQVVRASLRRTDILSRYGGEEFTIYLPHTAKAEAEMLANRVMNAVGNNRVPIGKGDQTVSITISVGVVSASAEDLVFEDPKEYLRELYSRADNMLYQAKNEGRNRVVCF